MILFENLMGKFGRKVRNQMVVDNNARFKPDIQYDSCQNW